MADDRHDAPTDPPAPTDAEEVAALRDLGLDALLGDGAPPTAWLDVEASARRVAHRRTRVLSAAAALILVAGLLAGVLIARSGSEGTTADMAANADGLWVLPPEGATILGAHAGLDAVYVDPELEPSQVRFYAISYLDEDGNQLVVSAGEATAAATGPNPGTGTLAFDSGTVPPADPAAGLLERMGFPPGWPAIELPDGPLGSKVLTCLGWATSASGTVAGDGTDTSSEPRHHPSYPVGVMAESRPGWLLTLALQPDGPGGSGRGGSPCEPALDRDATVLAGADALRLVDAETWRAFMEEHAPPRPPDTAWQELQVEPTTTMPPEPAVSIPDEEAARAEITAAFEGLPMRDEDGTWPHLEYGEDVAYYDPMFTAAKEASGTLGEATYAVTGIRFTAPDRAEVTFRISAVLEAGPLDYGLRGEAIRKDGRWLVTRATVTSMLRQAPAAPSAARGGSTGGQVDLVPRS